MYVHVFGAYFGLAVSFVFGVKAKPKEHRLEGATYQSGIFAMIGKNRKTKILLKVYLNLSLLHYSLLYTMFSFMQTKYL